MAAKRRRQALFAVAALLLATAAAIAQAPQNPDGVPARLSETECYRCHTVDVVTEPRLEVMYELVPPANLTPDVGQPFDYDVEVRNGWTAEVYDIVGHLDLTAAPSLGFSPGRDPVHQEVPDTLVLGEETDERTVRATLEVPQGATDFVIRLVPGDRDSPLAPDLDLRLWPPAADPDRVDPIEVADEGSGGAERYQVKGGQQIAEAGVGNWTVEATQSILDDLPASLVDQEMSFRLDAWFNVTGERVQIQSSGARLDGQEPETPQETTLTWTLVAEQEPDADEYVVLTVNATGHFSHPGSTSNHIDTWRFTKGMFQAIERPGQPTGTGGPGGPTGPGTDPEPPLPPPAIPWVAIGEIIGYIAAFLLVFSMVSGGVFGKASRRGLNRVFKSAKRRVAFHNVLSYLLTFVAIVHTVLFILETRYTWTLGIIWGGAALLAMLLLGVTGAFQVPIIRRWNFATWRWTHFWLGIAAVVLTVVHILLDGVHFVDIAEAIGWRDPFTGGPPAPAPSGA